MSGVASRDEGLLSCRPRGSSARAPTLAYAARAGNLRCHERTRHAAARRTIATYDCDVRCRRTIATYDCGVRCRRTTMSTYVSDVRCRRTIPTYDVDVRFRRTMSTYDSEVRFRRTIPTYDSDERLRRMMSTYDSDVRCRRTIATYDVDVRSRRTIPTYDSDVRFRRTIPTYDSEVQLRRTMTTYDCDVRLRRAAQGLFSPSAVNGSCREGSYHRRYEHTRHKTRCRAVNTYVACVASPYAMRALLSIRPRALLPKPKPQQRRWPREFAPLVAISVRDALPRRQHLLGLRSVASCDEGLFHAAQGPSSPWPLRRVPTREKNGRPPATLQMAW